MSPNILRDLRILARVLHAIRRNRLTHLEFLYGCVPVAQ